MLAELIFAQIICQMGFFQFTTQTTPFLALFVCVHAVCLRSISISSIFLWSFPPPRGKFSGGTMAQHYSVKIKGHTPLFPTQLIPSFFMHVGLKHKLKLATLTFCCMSVCLAYNEHKYIKNASETLKISSKYWL